ncbi:hypothetical protein SAMN05444515_12313 [Ectothiorhodospira marina]|uniref:Transposase IS200-like domain-containing protein n=1 Tax=Ectothiorhodospira marina TaxID=1396821 RepID=A0A1H7RHC1_9GAMM|nr:hypothetical protein SAMN05444515_12313 [Ectothiorhodospira marina]
MSNHYHLVAKLDPAQAEQWSDDEVLRRWSCLFKGPLLVQRYLAGASQESYELSQVAEFAQCYRRRLADLSWFMKCLNEPIARQANREDGCSGHFWEARFKSQALRTEAALLSCMAYVDLNPVRAGMAATPETSAHTSIRERITPRFNLAQAVREQMGQGVHLHHVGAGLARENGGHMGRVGRCCCSASPAGRLPRGVGQCGCSIQSFNRSVSLHG